MSTAKTLNYLRGVMGTEGHPDWVDHIKSTNTHFELRDIPISNLNLELSGLNKDNVKKYSEMDISKSPPIVVGSTNHILDGYHRAHAALNQGLTTIRAYVGVNKKSNVS